jgi:hypothetical protein
MSGQYAFAALLCGYDPAQAKKMAERPVLFWRPGAEEGKRVYQTWEALFYAFKNTTGPVVIAADETHGLLIIPSGYWDLQGRATITGAHGVPGLWFAKEAHLQNVRYSRIELKFGKKRPKVPTKVLGPGFEDDKNEEEDDEETDPEGPSPWNSTVEKVVQGDAPVTSQATGL